MEKSDDELFSQQDDNMNQNNNVEYNQETDKINKGR